jgi:hypothetical protein
MIDIIGASSLTALFAVCSVALIGVFPVGPSVRSKFAVAAGVWFTVIALLGAAGVFSTARGGTLAIGAAVATPVLLLSFAARHSPVLRRLALGTPLAVLVGIHAGRLLGVFFLLLLDAGRLPPTFARTAGWGDIAVALAALPIAWAIHAGVRGWPVLTLAWNLIAFVDLVIAVTLGVGSAPNSPLRFIFEGENRGAIADLPWVMIPGVLVPLYLLTHLAIFAQLTDHLARKPADGAAYYVRNRTRPLSSS